MDWMNIEPDVYRLLTKHYTPGRGGRSIKYIVRHHNAGILSIEDCWQVWQTREASAHYQVENSGRIGQLVNDSDTAWHAASLIRNQESIGIEHANSGGAGQDWPISDTVIKQGARLAAALCRFYNLGRPEFGKNIRDHKETGQTACPYHLAAGGKYHAAWMAEAQRFYDELTGKGAPASSPAPNKEEEIMSEKDEIINGVNGHTAAFITGYLGPQINAIQDIWQQLRGRDAKGWEQLGKNAKGQYLSLVDGVAAARIDVANLSKEVATLQASVDTLLERIK